MSLARHRALLKAATPHGEFDAKVTRALLLDKMSAFRLMQIARHRALPKAETPYREFQTRVSEIGIEQRYEFERQALLKAATPHGEFEAKARRAALLSERQVQDIMSFARHRTCWGGDTARGVFVKLDTRVQFG